MASSGVSQHGNHSHRIRRAQYTTEEDTDDPRPLIVRGEQVHDEERDERRGNQHAGTSDQDRGDDLLLHDVEMRVERRVEDDDGQKDVVDQARTCLT